MTIEKDKVLDELRRFDNIVSDYWELQKQAAEHVFENLSADLKEEDIQKILKISEESNIGQIARDALDISATKVLEEEEYSFEENK
jgi:hypothetical protein